MATPATPTPAVNVPAEGSSQVTNWMDNMPSGDLLLDDIFSPSSTPQTPEPPAAPQAPAPAAPEEPFLKAGSTVYKTREEAERSLAYKDEVVERLRQIEIQRTGIDPLTGKAAPRPQEGPVNYRQNQKAYFEDLYQAATKNDQAKYFETQQKLVYDVLEPIAPIITDFTRAQAVATVSAEIKDFGNFMKSPEYKDTLEALPELRDAIELAQSDLNYAQRLPQLLKTAYWATQGRKTPELVSTAVQTANQQHQNTPAARPTTAPATMAPPTPGARPSFTSSEGRKAIIAQLEDKIGDVVW